MRLLGQAWRRLGLVIEILWTYALVRLTMDRRDIRASTAWLRTRCRHPWPLTASVPDRRLALATVRTLSKLPTDSRCLMRSLVLIGLLARRDIDTTLVIGVRPEGGFAAHAWVQRGERELLSSGAGEFERLMDV
jgi:hypothetical protein